MINDKQIADIEKALGLVLPGAYRDYLQQHLAEDRPVTDLILLYGSHILVQRNNDYEVQHYLPSWISIGDDSGGRAICLHCNPNDPAVYITGYGALDTGSMEVLSTGFEAWVQDGFPLDIIREAPDLIAFRSSETFQLRSAWMALHRALAKLESAKATLDLKSYIQQKRMLQQQLKHFEQQHAGKNYRP